MASSEMLQILPESCLFSKNMKVEEKESLWFLGERLRSLYDHSYFQCQAKIRKDSREEEEVRKEGGGRERERDRDRGRKGGHVP